MEARHNNIERSASSARKETTVSRTKVQDTQPLLPLAKSGSSRTLCLNYVLYCIIVYNVQPLVKSSSLYILHSLLYRCTLSR